jgi:hypothetical protein
MNRGVVLSICDRTGNMVRPWLDAGYDAVTLDMQDAVNPHPHRIHYTKDVRGMVDRVAQSWKPVAVFAFPPCTHFAVSGARWFREKGLDVLIDALEIVNACRKICEKSGAPFMLENPVGTLSTITDTYWRGPDQSFNPNDYGDPYTKKTLLWTGGGFVMPPVVKPGDMFEQPTWVEPSEGSKMHLLPPSADRADKRSETPMGFARAVFEANAPHLKNKTGAYLSTNALGKCLQAGAYHNTARQDVDSESGNGSPSRARTCDNSINS